LNGLLVRIGIDSSEGGCWNAPMGVASVSFLGEVSDEGDFWRTRSLERLTGNMPAALAIWQRKPKPKLAFRTHRRKLAENEHAGKVILCHPRSVNKAITCQLQ
jgi:hypothetical protein